MKWLKLHLQISRLKKDDHGEQVQYIGIESSEQTGRRIVKNLANKPRRYPDWQFIMFLVFWVTVYIWMGKLFLRMIPCIKWALWEAWRAISI